MQQKKRHHYLPKAYLKAFCNSEGKVQVYRKESPNLPLQVKPDATQFRGYYYSQPTPDGKTDNNTLEDFFAKVEAPWPETVIKLQRRENVNDRLENIFQFMALQQARVPASRDATEAVLSENVRSTINAMLKTGKLPPPSQGLEDILDSVEISIDPHQSIHAMVKTMEVMATIFNKIGLAAVHNDTSTPFLTSDNPVAWFDPTVPFELQQPYRLKQDGKILLIFPVSPTVLLLGSTEYQKTFATHGLIHTEAISKEWVEQINAQTCRFGYEAVISQHPGQEELIEEFAALSPVHQTTGINLGRSELTLPQFVFGPRAKKPKWRNEQVSDSVEPTSP